MYTRMYVGRPSRLRVVAGALLLVSSLFTVPYVVEFGRWCVEHPLALYPDVEALPSFLATLYFLVAHCTGYELIIRGLGHRASVELFRKLYIIFCITAAALLAIMGALFCNTLADIGGYGLAVALFLVNVWVRRKIP